MCVYNRRGEEGCGLPWRQDPQREHLLKDEICGEKQRTRESESEDGTTEIGTSDATTAVNTEHAAVKTGGPPG